MNLIVTLKQNVAMRQPVASPQQGSHCCDATAIYWWRERVHAVPTSHTQIHLNKIRFSKNQNQNQYRSSEYYSPRSGGVRISKLIHLHFLLNVQYLMLEINSFPYFEKMNKAKTNVDSKQFSFNTWAEIKKKNQSLSLLP